MFRQPGLGAAAFASTFTPPVSLAMRMLLDADIQGRENVPAEAPYIVTANHLSLIDPVLVSAAIGRLVRFLALDELFGQSRVLDRMMLYFGSIPISRVRPPLGAIKQALRVLDDGEVLGIFPEGARAQYWGERTIKRGAAWLSLATSAPIVPVSIVGTEATMSLDEPRVRIPAVRLTVHPAIDPAPYIDHEDPLVAIMREWVSVIDNQIGHWVPKEK